MKVLLINTFDRGGAANSCKRLHLALLEEGVDSKLLLRTKQNNWPESYQFQPVIEIPSVLKRIKNKGKRLLQEFGLYSPKPLWKEKEVNFIKRRQRGLEMFSFPYSGFDITQSKLYQEADIINLHWVANFLDFRTFFEKNTKPVVWTLHDMNPFSGGEHYEEEYLGIDEAGKPVARKFSSEDLSLMEEIRKQKEALLKNNDKISIVAPSRWLAEKARQSLVFKDKPVYHIPYGLDEEIFKPRERKFSRDVLSLPREKLVVLFVADSITNNRKGLAYLEKAFLNIQNRDVCLCAIGERERSSLEKKDNVFELGAIKDERLMSIAYSAADVFVIPSLMDNLPNTVLESLMCGTPVIGFPIGGIPDMVVDGHNGFLTRDISVSGLTEALNKFIKEPDLFNRSEIRKEAVQNYSKEFQAKKYKQLFENILN